MKTHGTSEHVLQLAACPKCGLEAKTLLHPFCQHADCPVLGALGREPIGGMLEPIVNPTKPLVECDHEWERFDYDPSVGMTSGGKICTKCGETADDDCGSDFDDC